MVRESLRLSSRSPQTVTPTPLQHAGPTMSSLTGSRIVRFLPVDVSEVVLPRDLETKLVSGIAENMHEIWAKGLIDRGWSFASVRDDEKKKHHLLIPFNELTEEEKAYDVDLARDTLKVLMKKGFAFKKTGRDLSGQLAMKLDESYRQSNGYIPHPLDDRNVELSSDLLMLGEMLAENMHNVWGSKRWAKAGRMPKCPTL